MISLSLLFGHPPVMPHVDLKFAVPEENIVSNN
jgi:hypothetical protein